MEGGVWRRFRLDYRNEQFKLTFMIESENSALCVGVDHKSYKVGRLSLLLCGQSLNQGVGKHACMHA